ncbi:integrase [Caldimonas brevitalea]|nr:integrase [Caldimonas brevitalea]
MKLLPRMEARPLKNGGFSYRYHPLGGKPIPLGRDYANACRQVLDMIGQNDAMGTVKWVWDRFTDPDRPAPRWKKMADGTRDDYRLAWKELDKTFGKMQIARIDSPMVARYVNIERAAAPRRAAIEKSLLSNLCRHGITLGVCKTNPTIGVETPPTEPRTEAPDPGVLRRFLEWLEKQTPQRRIIGMGAEYASLAGNRKVEFLDLCWPQVDRPPAEIRREILAGRVKLSLGEIRVKRAKQRGKKRGEVIEVIEITPQLDALLDRLEALREERGVDCLYVFPTRDNNAYSARGFKTLWQRSVLLAIEEKVITEETRFTFHDLRAYYTTVHKREQGKLPDLHANPATTARVYDRNKEVKRRAL